MSQFLSETPILSTMTARPIAVAGSSTPSLALRNIPDDVDIHTTYIANQPVVRRSNADHYFVGHLSGKSYNFKKHMFRLVATTVMSLSIMIVL